MVLGASGDSRLEKVLRGEHGWTYGARSGYQRLLGGGDFRASTSTCTRTGRPSWWSATPRRSWSASALSPR